MFMILVATYGLTVKICLNQIHDASKTSLNRVAKRVIIEIRKLQLLRTFSIFLRKRVTVKTERVTIDVFNTHFKTTIITHFKTLI